MAENNGREWVLPASIPFETLRRRDLEECVYWLFDAMGAKDLEWRTGGSGGGAADGGRDLEAHFYTPGADSEIEADTWWIECKGSGSTVDPNEVKSTVVNAQAKSDLDYLVIVTNAQFSNPTRDWVKDYQRSHPRPKLKLWDRSHLERLFSKHPDVVLRLFSEALSLQGRFQAMESRFWNKLEFVPPKSLADLWRGRRELQLSILGLFAAIANEFSHGSIVSRPWGAMVTSESMLHVLEVGLGNLGYLYFRCHKGGVEQTLISRAVAYLLLLALNAYSPEVVRQLVVEAVTRGKRKPEMPSEFDEALLATVLHQLLSELQELCCADCSRVDAPDIHALRRGDHDEIEDYWLRLEPNGIDADAAEQDQRRLIIEMKDEPCKVGFAVDANNHCPLFALEPKPDNITDFLRVIQRVAAFRKEQAMEQRKEEQP